MNDQWLQGGGDPGYLAWDLERWRLTLSSSEALPSLRDPHLEPETEKYVSTDIWEGGRDAKYYARMAGKNSQV